MAYAVASRLLYVGWVGFALRREERTQYFTRTFGVARGFRRFRLWTMIVMRNDAASLILTCILTRNTLNIGIPPVVEWLAGGALIVIGFGTKEWAARTLGNDAYYWHNFFEPGSHAAPDPPGPYRYIQNPMYTIGYLHAYGLAIVLDSAWGLARHDFRAGGNPRIPSAGRTAALRTTHCCCGVTRVAFSFSNSLSSTGIRSALPVSQPERIRRMTPFLSMITVWGMPPTL